MMPRPLPPRQARTLAGPPGAMPYTAVTQRYQQDDEPAPSHPPQRRSRRHEPPMMESRTMAYVERREKELMQAVASLDGTVGRLIESVDKLDTRFESLDNALRIVQQQRAGDSQRLDDHATRLTNTERATQETAKAQQELLKLIYANRVTEVQDIGHVQQAVQQTGQTAQQTALTSHVQVSDALSKFKDVLLGAALSACCALLIYAIQHPR